MGINVHSHVNTDIGNIFISSVKEMWSTDTLRNESRLTTLKRNDGNRKREQQKESLREKIRQISSALNSNTHTKLPYDKQAEVRGLNFIKQITKLL